jgi:hypothetical protein
LLFNQSSQIAAAKAAEAAEIQANYSFTLQFLESLALKHHFPQFL